MPLSSHKVGAENETRDTDDTKLHGEILIDFYFFIYQ